MCCGSGIVSECQWYPLSRPISLGVLQPCYALGERNRKQIRNDVCFKKLDTFRTLTLEVVTLEQRYSYRFSVHLPVTLVHEGTMSPGIIRDASTGGLFIETSANLLRNKVVKIYLRSLASRARPAGVPAVVAHCQPNGVGVEVHHDVITSLLAEARTQAIHAR